MKFYEILKGIISLKHVAIKSQCQSTIHLGFKCKILSEGFILLLLWSTSTLLTYLLTEWREVDSFINNRGRVSWVRSGMHDFGIYQIWVPRYWLLWWWELICWLRWRLLMWMTACSLPALDRYLWRPSFSAAGTWTFSTVREGLLYKSQHERNIL